MTRTDTETLIRRLISSDQTDAAQILEQATHLAGTTRERQLVAIAAAHLAGEWDSAGLLAREHLVDFPDSVFAAWIADAARHTTSTAPLRSTERN